MRLEHYSVEQLKSEITAIIGKYLDLSDYKIFFFGSRLEQNGDERSDIDVGIDGKKSLPMGTLSRIKEDLNRLPLLYKIDIIDFQDASEDFRRVALQNVEWIHNSENGKGLNG